MKAQKFTSDGPFTPNAHFRAYVSMPGTTAGRRTLDDKKGNPLQFKTKADAQLYAESTPFKGARS